eukprot:5878605-Pyramimonas_sp.AAC.1
MHCLRYLCYFTVHALVKICRELPRVPLLSDLSCEVSELMMLWHHGDSSSICTYTAQGREGLKLIANVVGDLSRMTNERCVPGPQRVPC